MDNLHVEFEECEDHKNQEDGESKRRQTTKTYKLLSHLWRTLVQQLDGDDSLLLSFRGPDLRERRVPEEQVPED